MSARSNSIAIRLGLAAALVILVAIAATALVRLNLFADAAQWVNHTHVVIESIDSTMSHIIDAEASQRGFLLTGDRPFLDSYHAARKQVEEHEKRLAALVDDNPRQRERARQMKDLLDRRLELLEAGIAGATRTGHGLQVSPEHFNEGRAAMDAVRALAGTMKAEELSRLRSRSETFERDRLSTQLIIVAGNAVALVLLLLGFGVMLREIRQRRLAELRAQRYARQVEDLYNNAPCGYHSLDQDGVIVQINDTELAWLQYTRDEILRRKRFVDLLSSSSRALFEANFAEFKKTGAAHDLEYELLRKDGTLLPVALSATLVRDAAGGYMMSRSTVFDITERRRAAQALHRANAFLDSVLEHIPSMIFVKNAEDLRYVRFNRAGERALGLEREQLLGKCDADLFSPAQAAEFMEQDCRVLTTGQMLEVGQDLMRTPGGERFLHTRKLPIADEAGRPRYLLGISEDITERRRAELKIMELHSALELRARQLEETNQELESFSYSISHDLRSPLRAIDGFSRIVEEDYGQSLDQEGLRLLGVIRDNTRRMAQLIDDLLAFSRLGRKALTLNAVDMTALAQSAWQQLCDGRVPGAVRLSIDRLPAAVGDRVLLLQVWTNLLSNAIKYSSTCDEPAISVSASSNDAEVFYCVRDNGVGFDMRYSEKLFGVFQRLHSMDEFPGTGVGLAIVKRIVIRHGGRVWADSILGEGARFCFSLPRGQADGVGGAG